MTVLPFRDLADRDFNRRVLVASPFKATRKSNVLPLQGNEKHETAQLAEASRFMFPLLPQPDQRLIPASAGSGAPWVGGGDAGARNPEERQATISELLPYFLAHCVHEWCFSKRTAETYYHDIRWVVRTLGDMPPGYVRQEHILALKANFAGRGVGPARIRRLLNGLKSFLRFCQLALGIETLDLKKIRGPKLPRREVVFLTPEEMRKFISAIPVFSGAGGRRRINLKWLCFRAFVEVLRGTGMRLSEALSLTRLSVDLQKGEATIIGKGNKQRTVFFSPSALAWIKEYVNRRPDASEWLFALPKGKRLQPKPVQHWFKKIRDLAGLKKKVTAHVFRHTFATTLQMNGAPIVLIKELLGHELLETTCKFYLGTDKRMAKGALERYLNYDYDCETEFCRPHGGMPGTSL